MSQPSLEPRFTNRKRLYGHFDAGIEEQRKPGAVLFVNGNEFPIKWVTVVDTEEGYVKTLDVLRDGVAHATIELYKLPLNFAGREVELPPSGVAVETIRGAVEFWDAEDQ